MLNDNIEGFRALSDNFECSECHKTFKYDSHYQRHVLTHSDSRPFECSSCGKKFKRQDALKTHERTHSDDLPFHCSQPECQERFASKAALRYHELRHTNQSEFICYLDNCNKKFLTLGQLKQHQRTKLHSKLGSNLLHERSDSYQNCPPHFQSTGYSISQSHSSLSKNQLGSDLMMGMNNFLSCDQSNRKSLRSENLIIKSEEKQNDRFIDDFSEDEQVFIDQIWTTIKQENNPSSENKSSQISHEKYDDEIECPLKKNRKINPFSGVEKGEVQSSSATHSDLLLEFSRISSSGNTSSYGRLKQELRIIVGLIDKIKQEDEEAQKQAQEEESNGDIFDERDSFKSNNAFNSGAKQDSQFYQNDDKPFHDYECQLIHKNIPSEVLDQLQDDEYGVQKLPFKIGDKPLLKRKIKTAVKLVQYCKKVFLDERKKHQQAQISFDQTQRNNINLLSPPSNQICIPHQPAQNDISFNQQAAQQSWIASPSVELFNNSRQQLTVSNLSNKFSQDNFFPKQSSMIQLQPQQQQDQRVQLNHMGHFQGGRPLESHFNFGGQSASYVSKQQQQQQQQQLQLKQQQQQQQQQQQKQQFIQIISSQQQQIQPQMQHAPQQFLPNAFNSNITPSIFYQKNLYSNSQDNQFELAVAPTKLEHIESLRNSCQSSRGDSLRLCLSQEIEPSHSCEQVGNIFDAADEAEQEQEGIFSDDFSSFNAFFNAPQSNNYNRCEAQR